MRIKDILFPWDNEEGGLLMETIVVLAICVILAGVYLTTSINGVRDQVDSVEDKIIAKYDYVTVPGDTGIPGLD